MQIYTRYQIREFRNEGSDLKGFQKPSSSRTSSKKLNERMGYTVYGLTTSSIPQLEIIGVICDNDDIKNRASSL